MSRISNIYCISLQTTPPAYSTRPTVYPSTNQGNSLSPLASTCGFSTVTLLFFHRRCHTFVYTTHTFYLSRPNSMTATTAQGLAGFFCFFVTWTCLWFAFSLHIPHYNISKCYCCNFKYTDHNVLCSAGRNSTVTMYHNNNNIDRLHKRKSWDHLVWTLRNWTLSQHSVICLLQFAFEDKVTWSAGVGWQRCTYSDIKFRTLAEFNCPVAGITSPK